MDYIFQVTARKKGIPQQNVIIPVSYFESEEAAKAYGSKQGWKFKGTTE